MIELTLPFIEYRVWLLFRCKSTYVLWVVVVDIIVRKVLLFFLIVSFLAIVKLLLLLLLLLLFFVKLRIVIGFLTHGVHHHNLL